MTDPEHDSTTPGDSIVVGHISNAEGVAIGANARVEIRRYGDIIVRVDSLEELPPKPGEPPYKGLAYYTEADEAIYFGREQLSDDLAARLQQTTFLAVAGASGSGKSSLLRAGVVPRLRRRNWLSLVLTPTADPLGQLAAGVARDDKDLNAADEMRAQMAANPQALRQKAGQLLARAGSERLLLVIDQFEELFTQCHDEAGRRMFIDNLLVAARPDSRVTVLIGLRADFTGRLAEVEELRALVEQNFALLGPMHQEDLVRIIAEPARLGGWAFVSGLVEQFLSDVGQEPGRLPLLSHALLETWARRAGHVMTLKGYREAGGVEGAIAKTAEDTLRRLDEQGDLPIVQAVFLSLTELGEGSEDTRRIARRAELARAGDPAAVDNVLETLAGARLVTVDSDSVQVAHEALIRRWPRLREWLADNRERLRFERQLEADAGEWKTLNRDPGALYRGARLAQAREWRKEGRWSSPLLDEFLDASGVEAEKEAQEAKQLVRAGVVRRFAYALGALLVVALALAVVAGVFALQARNARTAVEELNREIRSRRLAAESGLSLNHDPERALVLAASAFQSPRANNDPAAPVTTGEARAALYQALQSPFRATLTDNISAVAFSPDGTRLVTNGGDYGYDVRVWDATSGEPLFEFDGHDGEISSVAFSPDGTRILTASRDKKARLWDSTNGEMLREFTGHEDSVESAAFSRDGARILTASADGTARVWDAAGGASLAVLEPGTGGVDSAVFSPDGALVATTSANGVGRIWDAAGAEVPVELDGEAGDLNDGAFSPDGLRLVAPSAGGTARIWDTATGESLITLDGHEGFVSSAVFSPDGSRVVTAGSDNMGRVYDAGSGRMLFDLAGHTGGVNTAVFNGDGTRIVTSSEDRTARIWDASTGAPLAELTGHTDSITDAAFSPHGSRVVTVSRNWIARLWDVPSIEPPIQLVGGEEGVNAAAFSPDGQRVVTANRDGIARFWDSQNGALMDEILNDDFFGVLTVGFSPDGRRVLAADDFRTARIWNVASGVLLHELTGQFGSITSAVYSPDGTRVMVASRDGAARVWDAESGELLREMVGHNGEINSAAFSPDGKRVVTAGADDTARIWDAESGVSQAELIGHGDDLFVAVFSPDGTRVVTGSRDRTARIWDAATGDSLFELAGHTDTITHAAFSPDGTRVITTSSDNTARLWDVATGALLFDLLGHEDQVVFAAFSPDGRRVVTTSWDSTARVWDVADGQLEAELVGHRDEVTSASFSPDGQRLLTVSTDNTARIWNLQPVDMLAEAQARLRRAPAEVDVDFCARYFEDAPDECPATLEQLFPTGN